MTRTRRQSASKELSRRQPKRMGVYFVILPMFASIMFRNASMAADPRIHVLPLGDSITRGDSSTGEIPGGYRTRLYQLLARNHVAVDFIGSTTINSDAARLPDGDHEGHSGERIDEIGVKYFNRLRDLPTPDVVLLHAGTNDIAQQHGLDTAPARLDKLTGQIISESARTRVIVAQIIGATDAAADAKIRKFNEGVAEVVSVRQAAGHKVTLVDMYRSINLATDMSDTFHPNQRGYNKMADAWFAAIKALGKFEPTFGQTLVHKNATAADQAAFPASDVDLIHHGSPSLANVHHEDFAAFGAANTTALNDGRCGGDDDVSASAFDLDGNWRSVFVLNTATNQHGYDITEIRTIAAFAANRACQRFELFLSFVDAPDKFVSYGFHSQRADNAVATIISITDSKGPIASGVKALRFDFKAPHNSLPSDEPAMREVDVFGTPSSAGKKKR